MDDFELDQPLSDLEIILSVKDSVILANHVLGSHQDEHSWVRKELLQQGGVYTVVSRLSRIYEGEQHFIISSNLFVPEHDPPNNYNIHFGDPASEPTAIYKGKITELVAETDGWVFKASHFLGSLLVNKVIGIQYLKEETLDDPQAMPGQSDRLLLGEIRTLFME